MKAGMCYRTDEMSSLIVVKNEDRKEHTKCENRLGTRRRLRRDCASIEETLMPHWRKEEDSQHVMRRYTETAPVTVAARSET
jgi:ribosomal protein L32E